MRYLGLDVGQKSIGVAVGEQLAREVATIAAAGSENFYQAKGQQRAISEIERIFREEQADGIVIGLPVGEDGQMTSEAREIKKFTAALEEKLDLKIHFTNETLTTFMAEDMLRSQNIKESGIKSRVHQLSAKLILQQFLEENV